MTSASDATLGDVTSAEGAVSGALRDVAKLIQREGYVYLTEAAEILQKRHTGRALETLIAKLPVRAFSHSRKEGWVIVAKDQDEQYNGMTTLIKLVEALREETAQIGQNLTIDQFRDLLDVCKPAERLLLRYILARIFGIKQAAKQYGMSIEALTKDVTRVDEALSASADPEGDADSGKEASKYNRTEAFHDAIATERHGGRVAWEKDEAAHKTAMSLIMDAVRSVHHYVRCNGHVDAADCQHALVSPKRYRHRSVSAE